MACSKYQLNHKILGFPSLVHVWLSTTVQQTIYFEGNKVLWKGCSAEQGVEACGRVPVRKRSSEFILCPAAPCIAAWQHGETRQNCQLSSKLGPSVVTNCSSPAEQWEGLGCRVALAPSSGSGSFCGFALESQVQLSVQRCNPQQNHCQTSQ